MSVLDWLFVGLVSGAILFGVLSVVFFGLGVKQQAAYQALKKKRPKKKKRKKRWQRQCNNWKKRRSRSIRRSLLFLVVAICSVGSGFYARYYQATNLDENDSEIIVQSYFLVGEVEKELKGVQEGADAGKASAKLKEVVGMLVSYTNQTPSMNLTEEGQQLLRRYYTRTKEFGLNVDSQSSESLAKPELLDELLTDITKIKKEQQTVFKMYGVNESALQQKK